MVSGNTIRRKPDVDPVNTPSKAIKNFQLSTIHLYHGEPAKPPSVPYPAPFPITVTMNSGTAAPSRGLAAKPGPHQPVPTSPSTSIQAVPAVSLKIPRDLDLTQL
jgi:hypothetical protein